MILNEATQIRFNNDYIYLVKLGNNAVIYYNLPLYEFLEFKDRNELIKVATLVNESHTDLSEMFCYCTSLTTINGITEWDTSNVTTMKMMFENCPSLKSLDLSNFDTSNVTTMSWMFSRCTLLTSLDLSNFDTSKVSYMSYMFYNCGSLVSLDLSSFDTSKVSFMDNMFEGCKTLESLDLSDWDVSKVTDMDYMFKSCNKLKTLDLSNWNIKGNANTDFMLSTCDSLCTLKLNECNFNTINNIVTSSNFPTGTTPNGDTRTIYCKKQNAASITAPDGWIFIDYETEEVFDPSEMIKVYTPGDYKNRTDITEVTTIVNESHTDLSEMFYYCKKLTTINTADWDTSNVSNMSYMFYNCDSLVSLDLSNFDTSNVTNVNRMFYSCENLESLNLNGWDISSLTYSDMSLMFTSCETLYKLYLNNCSTETIRNIIEYGDLPRGQVDFVLPITRTIYCDSDVINEELESLLPDGWEFVS